MILKAEKASSLVLSTLPSESTVGQVHSVYDRTVNILCDDSIWVSLHPLGIPFHPYCVRVEIGQRLSSLGGLLSARFEESARVSRWLIDLGKGRVMITLEDVEVWDSRLKHLDAFCDVEPERMLDSLQELIHGIPIESPFLEVLIKRDVGEVELGECIPSVVHARAAAVIEEIESSWRSHCLRSTLRALEQIVGLGFGLTPSGDDFLTGLLAASYFFAYHDEFRRTVFTCLEPVIGRTSLPSFFMLRAALSGHYSEPLRALLCSLGCGDLSGLRKAFDRLRNTGATSGQDLLAGVLFWLRVCAICGAAYAAH